MSQSKQINYNHRDLYLEILKKAEKEADRALVQMIARKLKATLPDPQATRDGCQVFSFPVIAATPCNANADGDIFWKNSQFWQDLVQFMVLLVAGSSWFIFFLNLLTRHICK